MDFVVVQLLTGLSSAAALFLVASGLTIIFGVTRVVNFAHGSLCMLGAYIGWSVLRLLPRDPSGFVAGVLLAAVATGAIGLAVDSTVARRPELVMLLWVRALLPGVMCAAYLFAPVRAATVPTRALARET